MKILRPKVVPEGFEFVPQTYYHVEVSCFMGNPFHNSILYTGFLDSQGWPHGYHKIWNPTGDGPYEFATDSRVTVKVIKKLDMPT